MAMNLEVRLRNSQARIQKQIDASVDSAIVHLDTLTNLFQLQADYNWFKAYIEKMMPLGVGKTRYIWFEEKMVRTLGEKHGLSDSLINMVINDLNDDPWGPAIVPSRAAIITRNDESASIKAS